MSRLCNKNCYWSSEDLLEELFPRPDDKQRWLWGGLDQFDELLHPPIISRLIIHYDNGSVYDVRDLKTTNANKVIKKAGVYLIYEKNEPVEISEGLFQVAKYAVDMVDISALELYYSTGERTIREFQPGGYNIYPVQEEDE